MGPHGFTHRVAQKLLKLDVPATKLSELRVKQQQSSY